MLHSAHSHFIFLIKTIFSVSWVCFKISNATERQHLVQNRYEVQPVTHCLFSRFQEAAAVAVAVLASGGWLEQRIRDQGSFPHSSQGGSSKSGVSYFGPSSVGSAEGCSGLCHGSTSCWGFFGGYPVHCRGCQAPLIDILSSVLASWRSVCLSQFKGFYSGAASFEAGLHGGLREQGYILPTLPGITSCSIHTIDCLLKFIFSMNQSIRVSLMMSIQGKR